MRLSFKAFGSATSQAAMGLSAACSAGFFWGTGAVIVNILIVKYGCTPENISFWRFAVGAALLLVVFGKQIHWPQLRPHLFTILVAGTAMAGYVLCWFLGIECIGAAIPTLIALCLPPVLVTFVALARGQETLNIQLVSLLSAALLGTVLIVFRNNPEAGTFNSQDLIKGVLYATVSAVLYAGFSLISGPLSKRFGAGQTTTCVTLVATVVMGGAASYRPLFWPGDIPPQAWFLYLGVVTAALALLAFSWGAARLSPTALTIATLVEPFTAVVLAALFLGEHLGVLQWLGGFLLLTSIWGLGRRSSAPIS